MSPMYGFPIGSGNLQHQYPPVADTVETVISTAATIVVAGENGPAAWFVGLENLAAAAQTGITFTCYDNASAGTGQIVGTYTALGASQTIIFPGPGKRLANGLTVVVSGGTPVTPGVVFIVR